MHTERHPDAGKVVTVDMGDGPVDFWLEDWWDHLTGGSWMDAVGNPAALNYAVRSALTLPLDNEVVYGKIGGLGYLVHVSEFVGV